MAIAHRATTTASDDASGDTLTITKPSGTTSGDVLVASVGMSASVQCNTPTGWTLVLHQNGEASQSSNVTMFYRVCGDSEPADYTFTWPSSAVRRRGGIQCYSGVDNDNPSACTPVGIYKEIGGNQDGKIYYGPVNLATTDCMLIGTVAFRNSARTVTPWSGGTERWELARAAGNDQLVTSSGDTGTLEGAFDTTDTTNTYVTILWALRPASGEPPPVAEPARLPYRALLGVGR